MLLSFLFWISDGTTVLDIPVAADEELVVTLPPMTFSCPAGVREADGDLQPDEDDPDVEFLTYEESDDEEPDEP